MIGQGRSAWLAKPPFSGVLTRPHPSRRSIERKLTEKKRGTREWGFVCKPIDEAGSEYDINGSALVLEATGPMASTDPLLR